MLWLFITIVANVFNALAMFLDKLLISKSFPRPAVLTFWTSLGNLFGLFFVFSGFNFSPSKNVFWFSILSGVAFTIALQFFYQAVKLGEATHIMPLVGATVPLFSFLLSYLFLGEWLTVNQLLAIFILTIGALFVSYEKTEKRSGWHIGMLWAVIAGFFFTVSYVFGRKAFLLDNFSTGFVYARIGGFLSALILLFPRDARTAIVDSFRLTRKGSGRAMSLMVINKVSAAIAFVGINFAISLASVTMVNALAGVQYVLLFGIIAVCTRFWPRLLKEYFTRNEIVAEIIAIIFIVIGLALLVYNK